MLKTSFIVSIIFFKSSNIIINKDNIDNRYSNKRKNLLTFSALQRPIRVDYLTSRTKKAFNFIQNEFI